MGKFLTPLINEDIDAQYSQIYAPFIFEIETLKCTITVPVGFVHDYESIPIIKGTSKRGGVIHDYLCRIDSIPVVTKKQAADAYLEAMECRDIFYKKDSLETKEQKEGILARLNMWCRRWIKYAVVLGAPGYFHKHKVMATYEEMSGEQEETNHALDDPKP